MPKDDRPDQTERVKADRNAQAMSRRLFNLKDRALDATFGGSAKKNKTATDADTRLPPGATVGGVYQIIDLIGQGGMGEVYLAAHLTLKKRCAVKLIPPSEVTNVAWKRFEQEAKAVANLDHVNLVKVTDLGIHKGYLPFYAMEYVAGETLADLIAQQGPLKLETAIVVFLQICDGVDYAHRAGIIHRDLKPANIMVVGSHSHSHSHNYNHNLNSISSAAGNITGGDSLKVKILDFGLAKLTGHDRETQSLTAVGDVFGSPYYMSPEQCSGEKIDKRSDVYSVGCTLFECLTGRPPFVGNIAAAVVFSHQESKPPTLASIVGPSVFPDAMEVIIAKLLQKNPAERYQSLQEVSADLLRVSQGKDVLPFYLARVAVNKGDAEARPNIPKVNLPTLEATNKVNKNMLIPVAVALGLLALTLSYYLLNLNFEPVTKSRTPDADHGTHLLSDPALNQSDVFSSVHSSKIPEDGRPLSASDTGMYSTLLSKNDKHYLCFDFPKDVSIGTIYTHSHKLVARGRVLVEADQAWSFAPNDRIILFHNFIKRFRPDEIRALRLGYASDSNKLLASLMDEPSCRSISDLRLDEDGDSNPLNSKSIDILNSWPINTFSCQVQAAPADNIAKLLWLPKLDYLQLDNFGRCTAILEKVKNSPTVKIVMLQNCAPTRTDFSLLATMPNLQRLILINPPLTRLPFDILHKAPKLRSLRLAGGFTMDKALPAQLAGLMHLETIEVSNLTPDQRATVEKFNLKHVKIIYKSGSTKSVN